MKSLNDFWEYKSKLSANASGSLGLRYIFTLIILIILFAALVFLYRKASKKLRRGFMITVASLMPLFAISRIIWLLEYSSFSISEDLPLQLCRLMLFIEPIAVFSGSSKLKTFCYAAGLPGALLAFVFPDIGRYATFSFEYLRYVSSHFLLALVPLLWVFGDRFRPHANLKVLLGIIFSMSLVMLGINSLLASNYFYVTKIPGHVKISIAQPWYFIAFTAFMMVIVTLMMAPFANQRANRKSHQHV